MRRAIILKGGVAVASSVALFAVACGSFRDASTNEDASVSSVVDASLDPLDASTLTTDGGLDSDAPPGDASTDGSSRFCLPGLHNFCEDFDGLDGGIKTGGGGDGGAITSDSWDGVVTVGTPSHFVNLGFARSKPGAYRIETTGDVVFLNKTLNRVPRMSVSLDVFPDEVPSVTSKGVLFKVTSATGRVVSLEMSVGAALTFYCVVADKKDSPSATLLRKAWNHISVTIDDTGSTLTVEPDGAPPTTVFAPASDASWPNVLQVGFSTGSNKWIHYLDNVAVDLLSASSKDAGP